ncbi:hypothetical protein MG296_10570 [Flavobacteriaceae bacterium TK19130]|nr:hypothetical protein [Thermobacterium salinum]
MKASKPSNFLLNKINVNPSVDRTKEATAEDFREIALLAQNHADLIDQLFGLKTKAKFLGFFTSQGLLETQYPEPEENDFAIITDPAGNPTDTIQYKSGSWVSKDIQDKIKYYPQKTDFPETGEGNVFYIATTPKKLHLWYNNQYNEVGKDGVNGASAYQVAVTNGFLGTEEEWLATLKGAVSNLPSYYKYVETDPKASGETISKVATAINAWDKTVLPLGRNIYFYTIRIVAVPSGGYSVTSGDNFSIVTESFRLKTPLIPDGNSEIFVGTGFTLTEKDLEPLFPVDSRTFAADSIDLGDIGSDQINTAADAYSSTINIQPFPLVYKAVQDDEEKLWLYKGENNLIGTGNPSTELSDFKAFPSDATMADSLITFIKVRLVDSDSQFDSLLKLTFGDNFKITQEADGSAKIEYSDTVDIADEQKHTTMAALYLDQPNQKKGEIHFVEDASGHPDIENGDAYFEYLGTTNADHPDYKQISKEEAAGGILDAPIDEAIYGRKNGEWVEITGSNRLSSATQRGEIKIPSNFDWTDIPSSYQNSKFIIQQFQDLGGASITLPDGVELDFQGGRLSNGTIDFNGGRISDTYEQIFGDDMTVTGVNCDFVRAEWFGATPNDDTFDNSVPILKAFDTILESEGCSKIKIGAGEFFIENPLIFLNPGSFFNLELEGGIMPYGNAGYGGVSVIKNTSQLPFSACIQGARGVNFKNIVFEGERETDYDIYDLISETTATLAPNSKRYAPMCGIVIDPFGTEVPPDGGYVGYEEYYSADAVLSSKIRIEKCTVKGYENGLAITPNSTGFQGDSITIDDVEINNAVNGIIVGQAQSRRISVINCDMKRLKYCFNTAEYGKQQGVMPEVVNLKIADGCAWMFNHAGNISFAHFVNVYAEALYGIGYSILNKYPIGIVNSTIKLSEYTDPTKKYVNPSILTATTVAMINTSVTVGGDSEPLVFNVDKLLVINGYLDSNIINIGSSFAVGVRNETKLDTIQYQDEDVTWQDANLQESSNRTVSYDVGTELYTFTPAGGSLGYTSDDFVFGKVQLDFEPYSGTGVDDIYTVLGKVESVDGGTGEVAFYSNLLPTDGVDFSQRIAWKLDQVPDESNRVYRELEIGEWDMDTDDTKAVTHGLSTDEFLTIRHMNVTIVDDLDNILTDFSSYSFRNSTSPAGITENKIQVNGTSFNLERLQDGMFDDTAYSGSGNRGWIRFSYIPD